MKGSPNIARTAALIGDLARASMLTALMSGKALTATELSKEAGITVQTASSHLRKLEEGGLISVRKQGRHKYFAIANEEVAHVIEGLMGLALGSEPLKSRIGPTESALRHSRVCYNHLAGTMGIQLYDSLMSKRILQLNDDELSLTRKGIKFVSEFGIELESLQSKRTPLCRECLDWSERRSHLAGSLGRAFLTKFESLRWTKRVEGTRIMKFSNRGTDMFNRSFPV